MRRLEMVKRDRDEEALEAIKQAEVLSEKFEERWWCAELHRLRAVFLKAIGAEANQIEVSFCEAIRIARDQKSSSLTTRSEDTFAEYRRQKPDSVRRTGVPTTSFLTKRLRGFNATVQRQKKKTGK
jgi:hypothetical protein